MTFQTEQPANIADVRKEAAQFGLSDAVIQGRGDRSTAASRSSRSSPSRSARQSSGKVVDGFENEFDATSAVRNVSASFSEVLRSAILAMIVSFLLITIYIAFRFQWRFAVPILRTIANDGLIAVGIYSSPAGVSASTVAAFLTIIGYSIYDDHHLRPRPENLPLMRRSSIKEVVNVSLWETIRRSIVTTIITLLPVAALYLFGGETLQDFAFAILVGISISAFSTIFVAAPRSSPSCSSMRPSTRDGARTRARRRRACGGRVAVVAAPEAEMGPSPSPRSRKRRRHRFPPGRRPLLHLGSPPPRAAPQPSANVVGSVAGPGRMAAPGKPLRDILERIAAEVAAAGNLRIDEARNLVDELAHRWRSDVVRAGERVGAAADGMFHDVGLATREDLDELELRVAQLEHRLRLRTSPAWTTADPLGCCHTDRMAQAPPRSLGRLSEIAQVAVRHGFGYVFRRNRLGHLIPGRNGDELDVEAPPSGGPPAARDARRAGADVRQVRAAAVDAAGHPAAGHHRRATQPPGRRPPVLVRARQAIDRGAARRADRAVVPRVRGGADGGRLDRSGPSCGPPNGHSVAVKVQRPGAPRQIEADLSLLYQAARLAKERVRALDFIDTHELVDEFARSIRQELDYRLEARNADTFRRNFAGHPHVKIRASLELHAHARPSLEYLEGTQVADADELDLTIDDRRRLAYLMTEAWMTMIFRHGFFHGDPHPANVLVLGRPDRIGLVDFGLAGKLTDSDISKATRLFIDAANENVDVLPKRLADLGVRYPPELEEQFVAELRELFYRYYARLVCRTSTRSR